MIGPQVLPNLAWATTRSGDWLAFRRALRDPERVQRELLARMLRRNAGTEIGRRLGFDSLRTAEDFQRRVPLCTYADLEGDVQRIAAGARGVLTRERVRSLAWTSGSRGPAKWIPSTRTLVSQFQRAIGPWIVDLFRRRPALAGGPAYWSVTPLPARAERADRALHVGFEDDTEYLGGWVKRAVDAVLAVPGSIRREGDMDRFRHLTLLFLLRARELRLISVWHPSFLTLLLDELEGRWTSLVRDVHDGFRDPRWPRLARGDLRRARELERAGPGAVRGLWPGLAVVSAWTDGHARLGAAELARRLPGVELQPKGLIATEAFVSLPFGGRHPLAVRSHFVELERDDGTVGMAHELEAGEEGAVVVTTGGGLYRYRLGDRVRVDGFCGRTPSVRFLGRSDGRSDLRGEKLSEGFVADAIDAVLRETGTEACFAMLVPETPDGEAPRYCLRLEAKGGSVAALAPRMESLLRRNPHYDACARLGQLEPCRVVRVESGYERYVEERRRRGQRVGDVKPPALGEAPGAKARS